MYPKNTKFLSVNVNDKAAGVALDSLLNGGDDTLNINGVDVKASEIEILDIKFGGIFALIIFRQKTSEDKINIDNKSDDKVNELLKTVELTEIKASKFKESYDLAVAEAVKYNAKILKLEAEVKDLKSKSGKNKAAKSTDNDSA